MVGGGGGSSPVVVRLGSPWKSWEAGKVVAGSRG